MARGSDLRHHGSPRSRAGTLRLFRRPDFTGAQLAEFAVSASFFALFLYTTLYLQEVLQLSPIQARRVYLPGTILLFAIAGATAPLPRRVRPGLLVAIGLVLVAGGWP